MDVDSISKPTTETLYDIKYSLLKGSIELTDRCLILGARWCSNLANSIRVDITQIPPLDTGSNDIAEFCQYTHAKHLFACREFIQAAYCLNNCTSPKSIYLKYYCRYLFGEKRKEDKMIELVKTSDGKHNIFNAELNEIKQELQSNLQQLDAYGYYLYGVVLRECGNEEIAIQMFVKSLNENPLIWPSWKELANLINSKEILYSLKLPQHWMQSLFIAHLHLRMQMYEEASSFYKQLLLQGLHESTFILRELAICYYNMRDISLSYETFVRIRELDSKSFETMDTYSNVLFVNNMKTELGLLAHELNEADPYNAITCFVVGNYYSMCRMREKAVIYFQRTLRLDRNSSSAWILLGHEYIELKQPSLANEAYRQANKIDRKDWRAWYGLGQTHELLQMPAFALHFYRHATELRPNDSRMLVALGVCYQSLSKISEAKTCFKRALAVGDQEQTAIIHLAKLHCMLNEEDDAAKLYLKLVEQADVIGVLQPQEESWAHQFLAKYYVNQKNLEKAEHHAIKCSEFPDTRESGKSLLNDICERRKLILL